MQTHDELLAPYVIANSDGGAVDWNDLKAKILEREDEMKTLLHQAGAQFGVNPEIAAEVFAEVGIGTPLSEEERAFIHTQFVNLMNWFQACHAAHLAGTETPPRPGNPDN